MKYGFDKDAPLEIGLYSLGDHLPDPHTGERITAEERINEFIQLAVKAEEVGLDYFGLGESHQEYFAGQAHAVILGAIAQATDKIQIGSSSTIVSTSDPVRIYENFATIDLISGGRAELVGGRASRLGLFDLLGYNVEDYAELYEEKFALLNEINENEVVNWKGEFRPPLKNAEVLPRPKEGKLPIWRAVGGGPSSAVAAGRDGVPMFMAHLLGTTDVFKRTIDIYRESASINGHDPDELPITTAGFLYLADDDQQAIRESYPYLNVGTARVNGSGFPKRGFANARDVKSVANIGSPELVVDKILHQYETFGMQRYVAQMDFGGLPFKKQMEILDILGSKVVPEIKKHTGKKAE